MSFDSLRIGASGLSASQKGVDVAGHNVANVNTTGYTRQRVVQSNAIPGAGTFGARGDGMRGTGTTVSDLQRLRNTFADASWRTQSAIAASASSTANLMERVENLIGNLDTGLPAAVNSFYTSFSDLSVSPSDPAARLGVLAAGGTVAGELNTIAGQLRQVGPDTTSKAQDIVGKVNNLITHVANLNRAVADALTAGQQPSDMLDERDRTLDQLATLTGARVSVPDSRGRVDVYLEGEPLVRGQNGYPLLVTVTPAGPSVAFADGRKATVAGELGGMIETATVTIPAILAEFDSWAVAFMSKVNSVHMAGRDPSGAPGGAFFTGTSAASMAVDPTLTQDKVAAAAVNYDGSGNEIAAPTDGTNALALSQVRDWRDPVSSVTLGDQLRGHFSAIGLVGQQSRLLATSTKQVEQGLQDDRLASNSVNVDEEMVDMVRYQRAFEAAARVVSVADQLLDTIINRTGRG